ncbi:site-2 protease family protein [Patescibacteria group bacterium]
MEIIFFFVILLYSAIIHEYAHGWMADRLGDPTAKSMGRLSMNPIVHIDPIGSIFVPIALYIVSAGTFFFAWAKPVPYNPHNLKDPENDGAKIAFAGPASNFIVAIICGILIRFLPFSHFTSFLGIVVYINVLLAVFNLVPIPPLDGSKLLFAILPASARDFKIFMSKYGSIIILAFIFFGFELIIPIILFLYRIITGGGRPF